MTRHPSISFSPKCRPIIYSEFILIIFLVMGSCVNAASAGDPPSTVVPFPGTPRSSGEAPEAPPPLDQTYFRRELPGYVPGEPTHPGSSVFCQAVAEEISERSLLNLSVEHIVITGCSDGIPVSSKGIPINLESLPPSCLEGITFPIRNPQLALLRGSIIYEELSHLVSSSNAGKIVWKTIPQSEKDGGPQGPDIRRVQVEVYLRRNHGKRSVQ